jgi:hypothetical protein
MFLNKKKLPPFDQIVKLYVSSYLEKLNGHMLPKNNKWKWLIFVIESLHLIIGTSIFTLGLFLPPVLLPYNILLITIVIVGWQLLGYCLITKFVSKITGNDSISGDLNDAKEESRFLIPFSETFLKLYGMLIIGLSLFFHLKPSFAPYNLIVSVFNFLKNLVLKLIK